MPQTDKGLHALMIAIRTQMAEGPGAGEHRVMLQRGTVPFSLPASVRRAAPVVAEGESQVRTESGAFIVEGIASSTSVDWYGTCLLYTSPSPRDGLLSRMPSSA